METQIGRGIIFDMDGVLTDSEWFIAEAARLMFQETHHQAVSHGDFLPFVGLGENRFLGGVAEKYGIETFDLERDKARTYAIYGDIARGKLKALPGALAFVRRCRILGCKTALATSTDYAKMMINLTEIGLAHGAVPGGDGSANHGSPGGAAAGDRGAAGGDGKANHGAAGVFDALVNGLDVERRKPFPDIFLEAARRIRIEPRHCWVVEDSVGGVAAAKAAGMRCLALLSTFPEGELRAAGADRIVRDLSCIEPEDLLSGA
ncbi:MAG: HAD-IA family hydrolase [Treponema sp.]|jgi:beta-phosphoglucomutase-like phosphatase (HAD superfamily)|nr:HAD-IA family hydrolase [Treponema sp.]